MKREPEPIEQRDDDANVTHSRLSSNIPRKRLMAASALALTALMLAIYIYHQSAYQRNANDWRLFWVGEVFICVWLVFAVVQVLRKGP